MRSFMTKIFVVVFAATMMFTWTGCSKEGPQGPKGNSGNANVIASEWLLFRDTRPDLGGSVQADVGNNELVFEWRSYALPTVMAPVLESEAGCVICVYFSYAGLFGNFDAYMLPVYFASGFFGQKAIMTANVNVNATKDPKPYIDFQFSSLTANGLNTGSFKANLDTWRYRVIVVPQAATRSTGNQPLKETLENMSYLEVCEHYGINP